MTRVLAVLLSGAVALLPGVAAAQAASQADASDASGGSRFTGNHAFRAFNCHGGDAVISGDFNQLKLADCSRLTLTGMKNHIYIVLSSPGDIVVGGSGNVVRYRAPDDGPPRVTDNGRADDIQPTAN